MTARYDLAARPPLTVLLPSVAQHMGLMAVTLVFPLLIARAAGADAAMQGHYLALAMLAMGLATLAQASGCRLGAGPVVGSGFLLPSVFTAAYLPPALAAAASGGLGAVAGLTIAAGLTQMALSRVIRRLRPYLPIEIVGLVVLMIGIILGIVAFKLVVGMGEARRLSADGTGAALVALAVTIGVAVWGNARLRTMSVLLGLAAGTGFHIAYGLGGGPAPPHAAAPVAWLVWPLVMPSFEAALLPGFLAGALACALRAFGDIVASQRANDREWKRPDYPNIEAGVLADGLGTLAAGIIGTVGLNTYSASVGLAVATEVLSRRVALGVGFGWIGLALLPGSSSLVLAIPQSVLGAALLFASAFIVLAGISILGQRLLDARRTVAIGLGFLLGISFDQMPAFYAESLPPLLRPVVGSSLVLGLLVALALNAVFQIGARKSNRLSWQPAAGFAPMRQFLLDSGGLAGARTDAIRRLVQLAEEFNEAAATLATGPAVEISTRFDEYTLELGFRWDGIALLPGPPPSLEDDVDEAAVTHGIVLVLMMRLADRLVRRQLPDGRQELVCCVEQ